MVSLRDLEPARPEMKKVLACPFGGQIEIVAGKNLRVIVTVTPDGVSSHLLLIHDGAGEVLFTCGGHGVANLTDESLAFIVVKAFRYLELKSKPPAAN